VKLIKKNLGGGVKPKSSEDKTEKKKSVREYNLSPSVKGGKYKESSKNPLAQKEAGSFWIKGRRGSEKGSLLHRSGISG